MIVNQLKEGWEIIFQRSHEMLAMQLALCWQKRNRPERWAEFVSAVAEHDNRQEAWAGKRFLSPSDTPLDFSQKGFSLEQARGVTEVSQYKSRYVALLISMHTSFLYEPQRGKNATTDQFLDDQLQMQQHLRKSLNMSREKASKEYRLLNWFDRFSLILCKNELPAEEGRLQIFPEEDPSHSIWQGADTVFLYPWPFEETEIKVWVEARHLKQIKFENDQELAAALLATQVKEKYWTIKNPGTK